jgi:ribonuclease BN (tRNA processing enzyme)
VERPVRLTFRGTRGSLPKPGPGTLRYGGNTSCVQVETAAGTLILLDCGTGAHALGQELPARGSPTRRHVSPDADLVIHDAQYTAAEYPSKIGWGHGTPAYAARLWRSVGVSRLTATRWAPSA